jgi:hypothetical protein
MHAVLIPERFCGRPRGYAGTEPVANATAVWITAAIMSNMVSPSAPPLPPDDAEQSNAEKQQLW